MYSNHFPEIVLVNYEKQLPAGKINYCDSLVLMKTTLGSCVSVVIYNKRDDNSNCSMSHYLMPRSVSGSYESSNPGNTKYGEFILELQIQIMNRHCPKRYMEAMIFGGSVLRSMQSSSLISEIGNQNIEVARNLLKKNGIQVKGMDVGGNHSRHVEFMPEIKKAKII